LGRRQRPCGGSIWSRASTACTTSASKLAALTGAASWLTDGGLLVADLDLASIRLPDGRPAGRALVGALRRAGFEYDPRRRRISRTGRQDLTLPYLYLGADDKAGPNYTNQPAVNSYYEPL
jgi:hypothetical protein